MTTEVRRPGPEGVMLRAAVVLGLAAAYFGSARLGLRLAFAAEQVTVVWPPTGIALAAIWLFGAGAWPGIAIGAFAANMLAHETVPVACGIAAGNTLEALVGVWLVRRVAGPGPLLARLRGALTWIVLAALVPTTVAATIGVVSLGAGGVQPWRDFGGLWALWWFGDAAGALLVGSLLVAWLERPAIRFDVARAAEAAALAAGLVLTCLLVFHDPAGAGDIGRALGYAMMVFIVWGALRFGERGVTAVACAAAGFAIAGTIRGQGPFALPDAHASLLLLQIFMALVAIVGLLLAAAQGERTRVLRELRESEMRYASLVEAVPGILLTADADGACNFMNRVFVDATGLPAEQARGEGWMATLHPADLGRTRLAWRGCVREGEPFELEFRLREQDGSFRWFTCRVVPVRDAQDAVTTWVGACIDIDARKLAEGRLRETDRRRDEFLDALAHELSDPLAPIMDAARTLRARPPGEPQARRLAATIERHAEHLTRLISDLLDLSRVARGRLHLHREPCDLGTLAGAAAEGCRLELQLMDLDVDVVVPKRSVRALGDPARLTLTIGHLLRCAASLADPGGSITLAVVGEPDDVGATIEVRYTGSASEPCTLGRLLEEADGAGGASGVRGWLGLRLVLVRNLVELHGGRLTGSGDLEGRDARFSFWLPLQPAGAPMAALAG